MAQNIVKEEQHMSLADLLPLLCLAFTAFIFNTSEFIPVGLLTDIASSFALTEAQTGMMISIYAWGVMILSVPLMVFASRYDYRRILLGVIGIFLIGQIGSALAPTFALLIAARLIVASAHAVFWSVATPAASQIAGPKYSSLALSMVASGSSVAMVLGMPLGRAIGLALGWRMTFTSVAIASFVALIGLTATVPKMEKGEPFRVRALPQLFRNPALAALYIMTILGATGYYVGYSYIEPFLQQIGGLPANLITIALTVFGLAGICGSVLFSLCFDSHRVRFIHVVLAGLAAALLLLATAYFGFVAALIICALWGISATCFNISFQSEVIRDTPPDVSAVAIAIFSGLFNLGIGCGSFIGGLVTTGVGIGAVGFVGALFAFFAFVVSCFTISDTKTQPTRLS